MLELWLLVRIKPLSTDIVDGIPVNRFKALSYIYAIASNYIF